jgi:hypothetical protein
MKRKANVMRAAAAALLALAVATPAAADYWRSPSQLVSVDVFDRNDGSTLSILQKDGRNYIVGVPGHEYSVRIRNNTGARVLAVTSVDGVNVISGETASPDQSGYVLDPYGEVSIDGWRKSMERTAAFYFTDLGDSYAARTGRPQNVGVIGVAVFRERQQPQVILKDRERQIARADAGASGGRAMDESAQNKSMPYPAAPSGSVMEPAPVPPKAEPYDQRNEDSISSAPDTARRAQSKLGTGHGRSETSYATRVNFERATSYASETIAIQYDRRENLVAMGVLPRPRYAVRGSPDPFPAGMRFAPDPPR